MLQFFLNLDSSLILHIHFVTFENIYKLKFKFLFLIVKHVEISIQITTASFFKWYFKSLGKNTV